MKWLSGYVTWQDIPDLSYSKGEKYSDFQSEFIPVYLVSLCSCVSTVLQLQVLSLCCLFPTHVLTE